MTHQKFANLLLSLSLHAGRSAQDALQMAEISPDEDLDLKSVLAVTNDLRERLLWIERKAANIQSEKQIFVEKCAECDCDNPPVGCNWIKCDGEKNAV